MFQRFLQNLNVLFSRSSPLSNLMYSTSTKTVTSICFNPSESSVLASVGSDCTLILYDIWTGKAECRVIMQVCDHLHSQTIIWQTLHRCIQMQCHGLLCFLPHYSLLLKTTTLLRAVKAGLVLPRGAGGALRQVSEVHKRYVTQWGSVGTQTVCGFNLCVAPTLMFCPYISGGGMDWGLEEEGGMRIRLWGYIWYLWWYLISDWGAGIHDMGFYTEGQE